MSQIKHALFGMIYGLRRRAGCVWLRGAEGATAAKAVGVR